jgi:hypothetical protein
VSNFDYLKEKYYNIEFRENLNIFTPKNAQIAQNNDCNISPGLGLYNVRQYPEHARVNY